jgi:hypothetical protein
LVRWGDRVVVLTARHVVKDAKKIIVELCTKKTHWATVLNADAVWDCAVLELTGQPEGIEPAEIEYGQAAMQTDGDRLESDGYGPDGQLAVNIGLFKGYRRSTDARDGRDDWMVISGNARGGDSGGPVFNQRGRVVGVLWGTDGGTVVCVQAGRVHATIEAAMKQYWQQVTGDRPMVPVVFPQQRNPTPPLPGPMPYDETARGKPGEKAPVLPWRGDTEKRVSDQDARIGRLIDAMERQQATQNVQPPAEVIKPLPDGAFLPPKEPEPTPLGIGLCLLAACAAGVGLFYVAGKQ